jgi:purine-binding chemotaxis protein CheW
MDIAKIRKKAKEKEQKEQDAEESRPRTEEPGEATAAGPSAPPQEGEGTAEEAGPAIVEESAEGATSVSPDRGDETAPSSPSVNKEGERGFSGEKEFGAEGASMELLTFSISNEEFAFRVPEVEEIARYWKITMVPTLPDYVRGITSLRGKIIPVLDLSKRLLLKSAAAPGGPEKARGSKILILEGPKGLIGATIDKVLGVVRFEEGNILDPPGHLSEEERRFIEGVVILEKRFISIIRSYDALDIELT